MRARKLRIIEDHANLAQQDNSSQQAFETSGRAQMEAFLARLEVYGSSLTKLPPAEKEGLRPSH